MQTSNKILLLSLSGRDKEPEDPAFLHLYLSSLKKHVVPYFDVKVLLLETSNIECVEKSKTLQVIEQYGLEKIVELKTIYTMDLPDESVKYLENMHWSGKIGLHMNMMFDYAGQHNFYNAEWIIHTDTDLEFLDDFQLKLKSFKKLSETLPEIIVSLSGDAYYNNIRYKGTEFKFVGPDRVCLYDTETLSRYPAHMKLATTRGRDHYKTNLNNVVMNVHQQKIRNDFVCLSRGYAERWGHVLNWISCGYPDSLRPVDGDVDLDQTELRTWYEKFIDDTFILRVNMDKGGWIQYLLKEALEPGYCDVTSIQLPPYSTMVLHYSSGWLDGATFFKKASQALEEKFSEFKSVWKKDIVAKLN